MKITLLKKKKKAKTFLQFKSQLTHLCAKDATSLSTLGFLILYTTVPCFYFGINRLSLFCSNPSTPAMSGTAGSMLQASHGCGWSPRPR